MTSDLEWFEKLNTSLTLLHNKNNEKSTVFVQAIEKKRFSQNIY